MRNEGAVLVALVREDISKWLSSVMERSICLFLIRATSKSLCLKEVLSLLLSDNFLLTQKIKVV